MVSFLRFSRSSHFLAPGPRPARSFKVRQRAETSCKVICSWWKVAVNRCWYGRNFSSSPANRLVSTPLFRRLSSRRCDTSSAWTLSFKSFRTCPLSWAILFSRPSRSSSSSTSCATLARSSSPCVSLVTSRSSKFSDPAPPCSVLARKTSSTCGESSSRTSPFTESQRASTC